MNPAQARQILAVATHRSFSKAALELRSSQASVSNAIASIEASLDLVLFHRTTRVVTPTAACLALRPKLLRLVQLSEAIDQGAAALRDQAHQVLKVGVSPVVAASVLDEMLGAFERKHPKTEVEVIELNLKDLEQALAAGTLDVAIAPSLERTRFKSFALYDEPLLVVGAAGPASRDVALEELADAPILMMPDACGLARATVRLFREGRQRLRRAKTLAMGYQLLERAALRGGGIAVLPRSKLSAGTPSRALLRADGSPARLEVRVLERRKDVSTEQRRLVASLREAAKRRAP